MAKIGQYAWAIAHAKWSVWPILGQFGSKIKNAKKVRKMIVRPH